jgi:hypothetical protein
MVMPLLLPIWRSVSALTSVQHHPVTPVFSCSPSVIGEPISGRWGRGFEVRHNASRTLGYLEMGIETFPAICNPVFGWMLFPKERTDFGKYEPTANQNKPFNLFHRNRFGAVGLSAANLYGCKKRNYAYGPGTESKTITSSRRDNAENPKAMTGCASNP